MNAAQAGWHLDPYGRHHRRYFDGASWTEHVADPTGQQTTDPPPLAQQPLAPPAPAGTQSPPNVAPCAPPWGAPQPTTPPASPPSGPPRSTVPYPMTATTPLERPPAPSPGTADGGSAASDMAARPGALTSNPLGAIVTVAGAVLTFIGMFSLKWLSVSAGGQTERFSRRTVGASLLHNDFDLDVGVVAESFFGYGWIVTLVVAGIAVFAAAVRQPAARLVVAALAVACALWTIAGAMGATGPWEDGVEQLPQVSGSASASLSLGVWFTLVGVVVTGVGTIIAHLRDSRS